MTRFLMITGAAAFLALPVATPVLACEGHAAHTASVEASTIDLAAAAKKALAPAQTEKADDTKAAPAK